MDPQGDVRRLYRDAENELSAVAEEFVARPRFANTLALAAENVAATTKIAGEVFDLALRNFRIAGRRDVVLLAKQLGRTEDKLERVLQELQALREEVTVDSGPDAEKAADAEPPKPRSSTPKPPAEKPVKPDRQAKE